MIRALTIGLDFDGTVVEHAWPMTGPPVPGAIDALHDILALGARLILWTVRSGPQLKDALDFMRKNRVELWGINSNPESDCDSPKVLCDVYVDDRSLGCPLRRGPTLPHPCADWSVIGPALIEMAGLQRGNLRDLDRRPMRQGAEHG